MSAGHTPGPWAASPFRAQVLCDDLLPVCELLWPTNERSEDETEANARLIAAAPDLLEALEAIDGMWSDDGDGGRADPIEARSGRVREIWTQARAAIAKARGQ